mgnify:CR=1 FL=1
MAAKAYLTYNGDPPNSIAPFRPTKDDFGGDELQDDQEYPPDPQTQPTADAWNQKVAVEAAHARVVPVLIVGIKFTAGAPVVEWFSTVSETLVSGDLTITDNAAGDTSIEWPADTLPPPLAAPEASVYEDVEIDRVRAYPITLGARVKTKLGATGTDASFQLKVY